MQRYLALDVFRGFTVALMILVNSPGSWDHVYAPLQHAKWHGFTLTDMVFPFFLFIIGSAIYFAFEKQQFRCDSQVLSKIAKRALMIFAIGLLLNIYPFNTPVEEWRIMGVLQRIAIAYALACLLILTLKNSYLWIANITILSLYSWALLTVPDNPYALSTNLVRLVDMQLLGTGHMYAGMGIAFDPEGIMSTLPSIVNVVIGFQVTRWISQFEDKSEALIRLAIVSLGLLSAAIASNFFIPINKSLWTLSYVLLGSGIACIVFSLLILVLDIYDFKKWFSPFIDYGTNPLFIYVLSWLWVDSYPLIAVGEQNFQQFIFSGIESVVTPKLASLIFALIHVGLFWWLSRQLYTRNIFIKL